MVPGIAGPAGKSAGQAPAPTYLGSSGISATTPTTYSFSHTPVAGADLLIVMLETRDTNPTAISSATYDGVSMGDPIYTSDEYVDSGYYVKNYAWAVFAPPSDARTVSVTMTEAQRAGRLQVVSIQGGNQSSPLVFSNKSGSNGSQSVTVSGTPTVPCLILWALNIGGAGTYSSSGDGTLIAEGTTGGDDVAYHFSYLRDTTGGVSRSQTWSRSTGTRANTGFMIGIGG